MKAGAFTPAIPSLGEADRPAVWTPLNEGGGFHPRNPYRDRLMRAARRTLHAPLNEGGGFHPRNPLGCDLAADRQSHLPSLNEGGGFHPRNPSPITAASYLARRTAQ